MAMAMAMAKRRSAGSSAALWLWIVCALLKILMEKEVECGVLSSAGTCQSIECPSYTVVTQTDDFSVRLYHANSTVWMSTSAIEDTSFSAATLSGFLRLVDLILFGKLIILVLIPKTFPPSFYFFRLFPFEIPLHLHTTVAQLPCDLSHHSYGYSKGYRKD